MKVSWIKYEKDNQNFKMPEAMGFQVCKLKDPEETDHMIKELIDQKYKTVIISNEIASFSEDIIKKYGRDREINIIIAGKKE